MRIDCQQMNMMMLMIMISLFCINIHRLYSFIVIEVDAKCEHIGKTKDIHRVHICIMPSCIFIIRRINAFVEREKKRKGMATDEYCRVNLWQSTRTSNIIPILFHYHFHSKENRRKNRAWINFDFTAGEKWKTNVIFLIWKLQVSRISHAKWLNMISSGTETPKKINYFVANVNELTFFWRWFEINWIEIVLFAFAFQIFLRQIIVIAPF